MSHRRKSTQPELIRSLLDIFLDDFGVQPNDAMTALQKCPAMVKILEHARNKAIRDLVDESDLVPDGYRLQGLIRGIDTIFSIPDRIKELNEATPE